MFLPRCKWFAVWLTTARSAYAARSRSSKVMSIVPSSVNFFTPASIGTWSTLRPPVVSNNLVMQAMRRFAFAQFGARMLGRICKNVREKNSRKISKKVSRRSTLTIFVETYGGRLRQRVLQRSLLHSSGDLSYPDATLGDFN